MSRISTRDRTLIASLVVGATLVSPLLLETSILGGAALGIALGGLAWAVLAK